MKQAQSVIKYVWTHPANRGRRTQALLRSVRFQFRGRVFGKPMLVKVGQGAVILAYLHASGSSKAVYVNPPDWPEMPVWRQLLRQGDLFVDVGANVGLYSVWAVDCGAIPLAIEPDPVNAARTRRNLELNGVVPEVHECALGAEPGFLKLTVGLDTVNHILSHHADAPSREVEVRALDDILGAVHARGVKVDVEGFERMVIEGASKALAEQRVDVMQLEWNDSSSVVLGESREPIRRLLESAGYTLCRPDPRTFRLRSSPDLDADADMFAVSQAAVDIVVD